MINIINFNPSPISYICRRALLSDLTFLEACFILPSYGTGISGFPKYCSESKLQKPAANYFSNSNVYEIFKMINFIHS